MVTFEIITALFVGLFVGSLLMEGAVLVPYWRRMDPDDFLNLHGTLGPHLFRFFAPLTVGGTLLPTVVVIAHQFMRGELQQFWIVGAALQLSVLLIYFLYFKRANFAFEAGTMGPDGLAAALKRWTAWHWVRTVIAIAGFGTILLALAL